MTVDFWRPLRKLTFEDVETLKESGDREKSFLDFKRFPEPYEQKDLAEDLAAFANSGGGRLVFGAREENERASGFKGILEGQLGKWTSRFRNAAHAVQPPVDIDVRDVKMPDGAYIFVIEIRPEQKGPFQYQGKYLQRASSGNVPMPHSSVVHAVAAAGSRTIGTKVTGPGRLDGNVFGPGAEGWFFGVEVSPAYESRRSIYDALRPEADEMKRWLSRHGYTDIKKVPGTLSANHSANWRFELLESGVGTIVTPLRVQTWAWLDWIRSHAMRFVRDIATCLSLSEPLFTVNLTARFWDIDAPGRLMIRWKDEEGQEVSRWFKSRVPITSDHEHQVCYLAADSGDNYSLDAQEFADRVCGHVKLIAEAEGAEPNS